MPFSRGSSPLRDGTRVSCIAGRFFTTEPLRKPPLSLEAVSKKPFILLSLANAPGARFQGGTQLTGSVHYNPNQKSPGFPEPNFLWV